MTAFVLDFASTLSRALGPAGPPLPFSVGPPTPGGQTGFWTMHSGVRKDDQSPVSVFVFDVQKHKDKLPLAQNALRRAKTIRHPDVVRFIDGCETESKIIIGTELVRPLAAALAEPRDANLVSFGLYKLASALKFLTADCSLVHANFSQASVFVTPAGEWKLGGLDLLSSINEQSSPLFSFPDLISRSKYAPPEVVKNGPAILRTCPVQALDAYGFACFIHELFNGPLDRPEDLSRSGSIPPTLLTLCQRLRHPNPKSRLPFEQLLSTATSPGGYFDNDFVATSLFLEQISLKDAHEKETYMQKINSSVETFPLDFCKYKILPELIRALEFGGAGAKALAPILKIAGRLNNTDFETIIVPVVVKLFALPDRAIRVVLCENLEHYINHLSQKVVSDKIFPNLASGFADVSAVVRESSLKSILVIIPKLHERIINNELLRILAKLQADEEPGIRTNTTICIGKISRHMNDTVKKKVLATAFLRSLGDVFPPARNAGLLAITATVDQFDPKEVPLRLIPGVSHLLIDPEKSIRKQASKTIAALVKKTEAYADTLPDTLAQPQADGTNGPTSADGSSVSDSTWAGWAISAVSSRLGSSKDPNKTTSSESINPAMPKPDAPVASMASAATPSMSAAKPNTGTTALSPAMATMMPPNTTSNRLSMASNPPEHIPALPPPPASSGMKVGGAHSSFGATSGFSMPDRFTSSGIDSITSASSTVPKPATDWNDDAAWGFDDPTFDSKPKAPLVHPPSTNTIHSIPAFTPQAFAPLIPTPATTNMMPMSYTPQTAIKPPASKLITTSSTATGKTGSGPGFLIDQWDVWDDLASQPKKT